ncbi:aldehyde dehydrogenase family protein [Aurantiacibacter hainanensis]|uniref:aldehyde dehydrogenase family protein n=1 Tax=Aurantiacibacter hainanensis TaxID=3076114 RepID=UPI0030C6C134
MRAKPQLGLSADAQADGFRLLIDGNWVEACAGRTRQAHDPFLEQDWGAVPEGSDKDVAAAASAARRAFADKRWSGLLASERSRIMLRLVDLIERDARKLTTQQIFENGKLISEMAPGTHALADDCRFFAGLAEAHNGASVPPTRPGFTTFTLKEPIGVVAAITPWNTPLGLLGWKLFPALAAGNTVVIKPSEITPTSTLMLAALCQEAGIPDGVVNVVTGGGETGAALVEHPEIDKIAFTGSTATGQAIASRAALRSARVTLEMGGKSPQVVFTDADLDRAVNGVMAGIFAATGQSCMAGSRVLIEAPVFDRFAEMLAARGEEMIAGDPLDPATQLGPVASKQQLSKVLSYFAIAEHEGLACMTGGNRMERSGYFVPPTVYRDVPPDSRLAREEIFGPVVSLFRFEGEEQAVHLANDTRYGLAAGIWTDDIGRAHRMLHQLRAGSVWVNNYRIVGHTMPFGGYGQSGIGREMGADALEAYCETKSVWIDTGNEIAFRTGGGEH